MNISEVLTPSRILTNIEVSSKDELFSSMVEVAYSNGDITNVPSVLAVIKDRENLMSTGIGHGIALPHGKTDAVTNMTILLATLKKPLEYNSLDGLPVNIVIMLLARHDQVSSHLKLLSKISRLVLNQGFLEDVYSAPTAERCHAIITDYSKKI